jgi:DNA-binding PadR family transcriptional regulator
MRLPEMTSLHFLVLHLLFGGERSGTQLREDLASLGVRRSHASVSRVAQRMIADGFLAIEQRERTEGSQVIRERYFSVTDVGVAHWHATRQFYASLSSPPPGLVPVETVPVKLVAADCKTRDKHFRREFKAAFIRFAEAQLGRELRRRR